MFKFHIGHTGITWGYSAGEAEQAVKDVAELGYEAYETFGSVILDYADKPGGFGAVLGRYGIPMSAAYCPTRFYDPADAEADIEQIMRWAKAARGLGVSTIVLQAGGRKEQPYTEYPAMAQVLNEIGRRAKEFGLFTAIHPHTGTLIETRAEIDAVLMAVDPDLVGFAPDTGQIQKGGADAADTLETYKTLIRHVHLKDYGGGRETGYVGYEPIGSGVVDIPRIMATLEEVNFQGWVMVELDGTRSAPRPPREAAAMSKRYLASLLGDKATWLNRGN
ncbi:MAG: sugar phosphate isomerase/epimerase [Chloroflexi bacterium]|nr:sugar phosphate isomerase/epimerase [Chloroflexota bacterium]